MKYKDVIELCRGIGMGPEFIKELEDQIARQTVSTILITHRCQMGVSWPELAARMECDVAEISQLEDAPNSEISSETAIRYLQAVGVLGGPQI